MSKRSSKKNKRPNLPQSTLDRARRQVAGEIPDAEENEAVEDDNSQADEIAQARLEQQKRIRERKRAQKKQADGEVDHDYMREMLKNPVKEMTEEDMREEYGHVVVDLRNMGVLAAALLVLLVVLAQVV